MASLLVQIKVKDFGEWKKVFDSSAGLRASNGALSSQVFQDASDPKSVTVLNRWNTLENAKKFNLSPELKAAQEKAGVEGTPKVVFLNEV